MAKNTGKRVNLGVDKLNAVKENLRDETKQLQDRADALAAEILREFEGSPENKGASFKALNIDYLNGLDAVRTAVKKQSENVYSSTLKDLTAAHARMDGDVAKVKQQFAETADKISALETELISAKPADRQAVWDAADEDIRALAVFQDEYDADISNRTVINAWVKRAMEAEDAKKEGLNVKADKDQIEAIEKEMEAIRDLRDDMLRFGKRRADLFYASHLSEKYPLPKVQPDISRKDIIRDWAARAHQEAFKPFSAVQKSVLNDVETSQRNNIQDYAENIGEAIQAAANLREPVVAKHERILGMQAELEDTLEHIKENKQALDEYDPNEDTSADIQKALGADINVAELPADQDVSFVNTDQAAKVSEKLSEFEQPFKTSIAEFVEEKTKPALTKKQIKRMEMGAAVREPFEKAADNYSAWSKKRRQKRTAQWQNYTSQKGSGRFIKARLKDAENLSNAVGSAVGGQFSKGPMNVLGKKLRQYGSWGGLMAASLLGSSHHSQAWALGVGVSGAMIVKQLTEDIKGFGAFDAMGGKIADAILKAESPRERAVMKKFLMRHYSEMAEEKGWSEEKLENLIDKKYSTLRRHQLKKTVAYHFDTISTLGVLILAKEAATNPAFQSLAGGEGGAGIVAASLALAAVIGSADNFTGRLDLFLEKNNWNPALAGIIAAGASSAAEFASVGIMASQENIVGGMTNIAASNSVNAAMVGVIAMIWGKQAADEMAANGAARMQMYTSMGATAAKMVTTLAMAGSIGGPGGMAAGLATGMGLTLGPAMTRRKTWRKLGNFFNGLAKKKEKQPIAPELADLNFIERMGFRSKMLAKGNAASMMMGVVAIGVLVASADEMLAGGVDYVREIGSGFGLSNDQVDAIVAAMSGVLTNAPEAAVAASFISKGKTAEALSSTIFSNTWNTIGGDLVTVGGIAAANGYAFPAEQLQSSPIALASMTAGQAGATTAAVIAATAGKNDDATRKVAGGGAAAIGTASTFGLMT